MSRRLFPILSSFNRKQSQDKVEMAQLKRLVKKLFPVSLKLTPIILQGQIVLLARI